MTIRSIIHFGTRWPVYEPVTFRTNLRLFLCTGHVCKVNLYLHSVCTPVQSGINKFIDVSKYTFDEILLRLTMNVI